MTKEKKKPEVEQLDLVVYPSSEKTMAVKLDEDYGGAHEYFIRESVGFEQGEAKYVGSQQSVRFVQKDSDGTVTPGLQSEQLLLVLIDRHKKLNAKFPSREGALAITKMEEALHWLEARVKERVARDVMGKLAK